MQALTSSVSDGDLERALLELAGKKPQLAELNMKALRAGMNYVKQAVLT